MTTFEHIYEIVKKVPEGKVATYKQVAILAGVKNPRVVGFAMRSNKSSDDVPCHRVVGSDGALRGYAFGGIHMKRKLLEKEGIPFLADGRVDLQISLYKTRS